MPQAILESMRLVLELAGAGRYGFSRFEPTADEELLYGLAAGLNFFQAPAMEKLRLIVKESVA